MPRLCANLGFLFGEVPFLDRFEAAAEAGFAGVEFASPYEYRAAELRTQLKTAGLSLVLINSPAGDRAAGERGFACLPGRVDSQALDYAVAMDCKLIHVMAGVPPADLAYDTAAALYAANLAWAGERGLAAGVKLVIEPLNPRDAPGYFLRTQEQGAAIVAALGHDRIGLQFDIYHCQTAQGDVTTRLAKLLPVVDHMQLADVPGRDELGISGWIGCEYAPIGDTVEGLAWRRKYDV
jgi:hydroxypyruvate isomerase